MTEPDVKRVCEGPDVKRVCEGPDVKRVCEGPGPRRFQQHAPQFLFHNNVYKADMQRVSSMFDDLQPSLRASVCQVPHLVDSVIVQPGTPDFGLYYGPVAYAAMFKFPCLPQLELCGFELILVPSLLQVASLRWVHFLLPVADINGLDYAVLFPPLAELSGLFLEADALDLALFGVLSREYVSRLQTLDDKVMRKGAKLAWKPKCKFELREMAYGQVAFNDVTAWQVAFINHLIAPPTPVSRDALLAGQKLLLGGDSSPPSTQNDLFESEFDANDDATQTAPLVSFQEQISQLQVQLTNTEHDLALALKAQQKAEQNLQKAEQNLQKTEQKLQKLEQKKVAAKIPDVDQTAMIASMRQQMQQQTYNIESLQQLLNTKKEHFEAVLLKELRAKHQDVGYYINFTLKHMFIDLEDEKDNWQDRYDALVRIRDEAVAWLKLEMQARYNIIMAEDPLAVFQTAVEKQVEAETQKIVAGWDSQRLLHEFTDLRVHLFDKEVDLAMYKDLYQYSLRAKEERFALQLRAARAQSTECPPGATEVHKAWNGLLGLFRLLADAVTPGNEKAVMVDNQKPLALGSLMTHLMHSALEFSKNEALQPIDITDALLLGCGRDRIDLAALNTQDDVHFDSPCRELFAALSEMVFDPRMTFVPADSNGVTLLDQALLAVAGRPMVSNLDDTLFFMKNSMGFSPSFNFVTV